MGSHPFATMYVEFFKNATQYEHLKNSQIYRGKKYSCVCVYMFVCLLVYICGVSTHVSRHCSRILFSYSSLSLTDETVKENVYK